MSAVADPLIQATLLADALDNGPVGVFVMGDDFRYVAVNRYACALLGYEREELLALAARDLAPQTDLEAQLHQAVAMRKLGGRSTLQRKDGSSIEVEFRALESTVVGLPFFVSVWWPLEPEGA
jgi:PAS domain S-box-containing protein